MEILCTAFYKYTFGLSLFELFTYKPLYEVPMVQLHINVPCYVQRFLAMGFKFVPLDRPTSIVDVASALDAHAMNWKRWMKHEEAAVAAPGGGRGAGQRSGSPEQPPQASL